MSGKVLVIGYGNPGRLDDGLGPALAERLARLAIPGVAVESAYQLTVEDAHEVSRFPLVIFADASLVGPEPFSFEPVRRSAGSGLGSHGIEPGEVIALAEDLFGAAPTAYVLAVRGYRFDEFGEQLSEQAEANLEAAVAFLARVIAGRQPGGKER